MAEEKKSSGAGKFILGAALGAIAGAIAGKFISTRTADEECECGEDCDCGDGCECNKKCECEKNEKKTEKKAEK